MEYKIAACIKTGFMANKRKFCIAGKSYEYYHSPDFAHGYNVKSEGQEYYNHSMSTEFFNEYFQSGYTLPDELFEI